MEYKKDEMAKAVLIGGVVGGVLFSFLPFSICILPCLLSGVITAYLMSKKSSRSNVDYIIAGGLSGGIAGLISWGLDTLIILIDGILVMANYRSPDEIDMEIAMAMDSLMMNIPFYILTGAIFGVIGGILYNKLKNK